MPKTRFGIDIEKGWLPTYQPLADRKDVLSALKKQAAKAGTVYLAPDPDREGEAIAWHLKEALGLDEERTRRVTFNEITKQAIASSSSSLLSTPQTVANFLTAMCETITNLKEGMKAPPAPRF